MVSDMRSTFDHAVGAHKNMVLQYDRMAGNIIPQFQASPVGVGDINGNKGRDIAMVANPQGRALSVDQRKRANEHVLAEFGLADDPNQRVKLIGTERRSSGEGALKLQIFHNGSVG
jgi:hypothetical protein